MEPTLADMLNPEWWSVNRIFGAALVAWVAVAMFRSAWKD